jgi:actin-related protein
MSRIVFIGGGSNIPGVRQRILVEVNSLIQKFKWSLVRGRAIDEQTLQLQEPSIDRQPMQGISPATEDGANESSEHTFNFVEEKPRRSNKSPQPYVHGVLRQIESLGPWVGASLVASLKVRGVVEIEREKFLQHGIAGASRESDITATLDRRPGFGSGVSRSGGERSSWTLGEWG